jgi:hypothetical protein
MRNDLIRAAAEAMRSADEVDPTGGRSREEWVQVNEDGWTLDTPAPLDHWVRHEGVVLSAAEFAAAYQQAQGA